MASILLEITGEMAKLLYLGNSYSIPEQVPDYPKKEEESDKKNIKNIGYFINHTYSVIK